MLKIKENNGVTLTALVITIIVLMIILSITINLGMDSINSTKDRKLQAELEIVQQACISEYTKAKELGYLEKDEIPSNFVGTEVPFSSLPTNSKGWALTGSETEKYKKYFRLTPEDLEILSILNSEHTYIVNYYTGEVYNETKKNSSEGVPLYIRSVSEHQTDSSASDNTNFVDW